MVPKVAAPIGLFSSLTYSDPISMSAKLKADAGWPWLQCMDM